MGLRLQYWLLAGVSGSALMLAVATIWLSWSNAGLQQEINDRQALIQQSQQMELPLYREIAQTLADAAVGGDAQIGALLAGHGIKVSPAQPGGQAPAATAAAPATEEDKSGRSKTKPRTAPKP